VNTKSNKSAPDSLNAITRSLSIEDKTTLANWIVLKDRLGFDYVAIMDVLASKVGIDPYNELDHLINNNTHMMIGLQAWKAQRKKDQIASNNESDGS